jgi:hypothetical protein
MCGKSGCLCVCVCGGGGGGGGRCAKVFSPAALVSVRAYVTAEGLTNVHEPLQLDATAHGTWPLGPAGIDVVLNVNMVG